MDDDVEVLLLRRLLIDNKRLDINLAIYSSLFVTHPNTPSQTDPQSKTNWFRICTKWEEISLQIDANYAPPTR